MRSRVTACLIVGVVVAAPLPSFSHVVLDPDLMHRMVVEIARYHRESRDGPSPDAEALFRLGEKVQELVDYQVRLAFSERDGRFAYDLAAFREYLNRAPKGKRAPEARFRLIARTFYDTLGADPARLVNTDLAGITRAVAEEERFSESTPRIGRRKRSGERRRPGQGRPVSAPVVADPEGGDDTVSRDDRSAGRRSPARGA